MATISTNDVIYATVERRGTTLLSVRFSGIASFSELLSRLRRAMNCESGLVTLNLRNGSQGWSRSHRLLLTAAA